MEVASKKRTTNFTSSEEELLITLVKKYKSVLECLKTDAVNAKMKKNAWSKIEREFNSQSIETPRTADILKNKYINLKRKVKKQYADEKVYHRGTGGGPSVFFGVVCSSINWGNVTK
ncbi:unnamed protein product [Macrosiphum euphorbiae]|uniref:Regulatory protein zeste n=1 Tax=Macrosiphum euphorbiae TaxID=13131 RepID=A0AAV0VII0_9HEMI|nr:unnamed protein product [Macrosiphum euphorbiae]